MTQQMIALMIDGKPQALFMPEFGPNSLLAKLMAATKNLGTRRKIDVCTVKIDMLKEE